MSRQAHRGGDFRDFLDEEGYRAELETRALKRAIALELERVRKEQSISKSLLAKRMKTSRAALDRLLDGSNASVTLNTIGRAARALKRKLKVEFVEV